MAKDLEPGNYCVLCHNKIEKNQDMTPVMIVDTYFTAHTSCAEDREAAEALANETLRKMTDQPSSTSGENMTNDTPAANAAEILTETDVEVVPNPTRLQSFVANHPRASRGLAITGAVLSAVGVVQVTRTVTANKNHLNAASDHLGNATQELSATVTPQSTEN